MADKSSEHPYGTCEGCGSDIHQCGGRPGDTYCSVCSAAIERERKERKDREERENWQHSAINLALHREEAFMMAAALQAFNGSPCQETLKKWVLDRLASEMKTKFGD